jgi:Na+/H+ antiporter NhaD/arsenite permease-like protein
MVDVAALIIFLVTYAIIAIQKIPRVHISRAAGALIGAVAMGLFGVLSPHEAYQAIDLDTIVFLLGMMIVVAHLEIAGFFEISGALDSQARPQSARAACARDRLQRACSRRSS